MEVVNDSEALTEACAEARHCVPENKILTARLLEIRKHGPPPFLFRNLRYVVADKARARRQMWDLRWSELSTRPSDSPRHLTLQISASQCVLRAGATQQLLHPDRPLEWHMPPSDAQARIRLTLATRRSDGSYLTFSLRNDSIRIWPTEFVSSSARMEDLPVRETFDLSSIVAVLGSFPAALSLIVEVYSDNEVAKPMNAFASTLRGELTLIDIDASNETTVRNGRTRIALRFEPPEFSQIPAEAAPKGRVSAPQSLRTTKVVDLNESLPDEDVMTASAANPLNATESRNRFLRNRRVTQVGRSGASLDAGALPSSQFHEEDPLQIVSDSETRPPDGWIVLSLSGTVQRAAERLRSLEKPRVHIACTYKSKELPYWDGIVRNDFVCPWCHRNCRRYRTLLAHFQFEHDQMEFEVLGIQKGAKSREVAMGVPFVFNFEVKSAVEASLPMAVTRRAVGPRYDDKGQMIPGWDEGPEEVWANPVKYRSYMKAASRREFELSAEGKELREALGKVTLSTLGTSADNSEASTEFNGDSNRNFLQIMHDDLGNSCKLCDRPHERMSADKCRRSDYCSEYCEMSYKSKEAECLGIADKSERLPPLLQYSTVPRVKTVNYKESLGKLQLYHIVSVCEVKEEHFDENDPDSEEEVDHSWRLELATERVRHLEGVSVKEKLLWIMWNKFGHDNYPLPSVYGARYTRFTLERFAFEYGARITRLKLRLAFVGFLRALHIHGMIDCVAITSIMSCLDRKKKRRDCNVSDRPELPREPSVRAGRGRSSTRGRRGRRPPIRRS